MLTKNSYKSIYRNNIDNFDDDFMIPSYAQSISFDRAAGYFSLNSLILSIDGIIKFIDNKGVMRVICSPSLSDEDIALITVGHTLTQEHVDKALFKELKINHNFSDDEISKLDIICNMISEGKLIINIAFMPNGIYHEKFGLFKDSEGNKVHYIGSANETLNAKLHNLESFTVNCSWDSQKDKNLIESQEEYFNLLWSNNIKELRVASFPEAVKENLFRLYKKSDSVSIAIDKYIKQIDKYKHKHTLYEFQELAIKEFIENGNHHFYEMATGTGKTFTSIKTIESLYSRSPELPIMTIICVPQIELQKQWSDALLEENFSNIFLLGGLSSNTMRDWSQALFLNLLKKENVICIAIYDTFFSKLYNDCNKIKHLFLIVDEAHNISFSQFQKLPKCNYRLGLSATIIRYSHSETKKIVDYFVGEDKSPYVYDIEDAINNGYLSHYCYYPIFVRLTEDEFSQYQSKTLLITYALNKDVVDVDLVNKLSQQRSLIVKQASNKRTKLLELSNSKDYNFKNAVVYCGQGKDKEDGESIINSVTKILYESGYSVSTFTSKTENRPRVLYEFANGYYDTLVAIKCFDEGVDVPQLDKIFIMASDTSLRQTVQRRGRVLRVCKETNKSLAYIYDMVVLPPLLESSNIGAKSLVINELLRSNEYARLADNKNDVSLVLDNISDKYNITQEDLDYERDSD